MTTTTLPDWLTPQTFARCGNTLFQVAAVKRSSTGTLHLDDGTDLHLLSQCHPATIADLNRCHVVVVDGLTLGLVQSGDLVTLTHGTLRATVRIAGADIAQVAAEFARAFDGVVVEADYAA